MSTPSASDEGFTTQPRIASTPSFPASPPVAPPAPKASILPAVGCSLVTSVVVTVIVSIGVHVGLNFLARSASMPAGLTGRVVQEGRFDMPPNKSHKIFYPSPFNAPPNLQLDTFGANCTATVVVEQQADCFTVMRPIQDQWAGNPITLHWKAEGVSKR